MKRKIKLSVVIPCYNEEDNLKRGALNEVWDYLSKQRYSWEVIVSDDGSSDESLALAMNFAKNHSGFRVLKNKHGGKPWAVWKGIAAARGELVLFTDMDQSTPIGEIKKLLPWFAKGFKVVIGSRGKTRRNAPLVRKIMALAFSGARRIFLLRDIKDTQCGFKALEREAAMDIFPKLQFFRQKKDKVRGWRVSAFDVEMLFIAQKLGYKIKEVEIEWNDRDVAQDKGKNFIRESWAMVKEIVRIKLGDLRGRYV